jgi:hypothetical protein
MFEFYDAAILSQRVNAGFCELPAVNPRFDDSRPPGARVV